MNFFFYRGVFIYIYCCSEIFLYTLDPTKFLSVLGLAWQAAFKKAEVKLELLTNIDMLLMVEKGIRGSICHTIHQYANERLW